MANAVIYARYSSDRQREESIEDQVRVCREEAERTGDAVVEVYADHALTGTESSKRAQFLRMISDSAKGGFEKVYVYKLDRFARNRVDSAIYRRDLKKNGVALVPVAERIPDGPEGIILESLMEGLAEYYSANLSQNVKRGMEGNAMKCMHNGVRIYGYENGKDGFFHVDEAEAAIVRRAFELYAGGMSFSQVCDELNGSGAVNMLGRPFEKTYISRLLQNDRYIGVYRFTDFVKDGGMPRIVDDELWASVQARLGSIHRKSRKVDRQYYVLTGKLYDAEGNAYRGYSAKNKQGRKYCYYQCAATGDLLHKEAVEAAVVDAVSQMLLSGEDVADAISDAVVACQDGIVEREREEADRMAKRVASIDRKVSNLIDLVGEMGDAARVAPKIKALQEERDSLAYELSQLGKGTVLLDREHVLFFLSRLVEQDAPSVVMESFIGSVVVGPPEDDGPGPGGGGGMRPVTVRFTIGTSGRPVITKLNGSSQIELVLTRYVVGGWHLLAGEDGFAVQGKARI